METSKYPASGTNTSSGNKDNVDSVGVGNTVPEPAAEVGIGLKSEWEITLIDAATGETKEQIPWHKNMILDSGLNAVLSMDKYFFYDGSYGPGYFQYIAVGTGNNEPLSTDIGLQTQLLRKQIEQSNCTRSTTDPTAPYIILGTTFTETQANGDLKEIGLCTAATGGIFFNRDLFRDGEGNPVTVTKTSNDLLTVKCKITFMRVSETPSTYQVTASDGTVHTVKGIVTNNGLCLLTISRTKPLCDYQVQTGTSSIDPAATDTGIKAGNMQPSIYGVWQAPHTGPADGFYRDYLITIPPAECNQNIAEICSGKGSLDEYGIPLHSRFTFSPALAKTSAKKLVITMRYSFSRL
ncbi:MAG: hypothetical protein ACYC27_22330 [Armatimonadota bacterium]